MDPLTDGAAAGGAVALGIGVLRVVERVIDGWRERRRLADPMHLALPASPTTDAPVGEALEKHEVAATDRFNRTHAAMRDLVNRVIAVEQHMALAARAEEETARGLRTLERMLQSLDRRLTKLSEVK